MMIYITRLVISYFMALRGPYTINHVAQHCVLCNMIDRVWCWLTWSWMGKLVLRKTILRNMIDRVWAPLLISKYRNRIFYGSLCYFHVLLILIHMRCIHTYIHTYTHVFTLMLSLYSARSWFLFFLQFMYYELLLLLLLFGIKANCYRWCRCSVMICAYFSRL
jgi:hypothetical protein